MSWLVGALQTLGGLTDVASTISGVVYQQKHLEQLRRQNDLQQEWMARNEQLQRDAMQLSRDLSTHGPALRAQAAIEAGFDVVSARQLAGSGERRINGYLEQPIRTIGEAMAVQSRGNLTTLSGAMSIFQNGTQFGMKQPKNWKLQRAEQSRGPVVNLGPRPPSTDL